MLLKFSWRAIASRRRESLPFLILLLLSWIAFSIFFQLGVTLEDGLSKSLEAFGANLVLRERVGSGKPLQLDHLSRFSNLFWKNNILAVAPVKFGTIFIGGKEILTEFSLFEENKGGMRRNLFEVNPQWNMDRSSKIPELGSTVPLVIGREVARESGYGVGDRLDFVSNGRHLVGTIVAQVDSYGQRNSKIFLPLSVLSQDPKQPIDLVEIRALTTQEKSVYRRLSSNPKSLPPKEFEKWFCTPFLSSITYNIQDAFKEFWVSPIRPTVTKSEGLYQRSYRLCLFAIVLCGAFTLVVLWNAIVVQVVRQMHLLALLESIGGSQVKRLLLLLTEIMIGLIPTLILGSISGTWVAKFIAQWIFGIDSSFAWAPVAMICILAMFTAVVLVLVQTQVSRVLGSRMTWLPLFEGVEA